MMRKLIAISLSIFISFASIGQLAHAELEKEFTSKNANTLAERTEKEKKEHQQEKTLDILLREPQKKKELEQENQELAKIFEYLNLAQKNEDLKDRVEKKAEQIAREKIAKYQVQQLRKKSSLLGAIKSIMARLLLKLCTCLASW